MRDRYRFALLLGLGVLLAVVLMPSMGYTRPEFAARTNVSCAKCHYNPQGGGMRNDKGADSSAKLSLEATREYLEDKYPDFVELDPALNDSIRVGADFREMFHDIAEDPDYPNPSASSTFYTMQAMVYTNVALLPIMHFTGGYDMAQNSFEAWGMIDNLPAGMYLRAGRFALPYGLRFDDHTLYTRVGMGFGPNPYDSGVEFGLAPGPFFLSAAVTNGNIGEQAQDRDGDYYAVTGQTGLRFWKLGLGFSGFHNVRDGYARDVFGPWFTFGIWQLDFIGEFDVATQEVDNVADPTQEDRIASSAGMFQAELKVIDGLYVQGQYTHMDPDMELDETFVDRTTGSIVFYPVPYLHTIWQYRHNREAERLDVNNDEVMIQAHVFF